LNTPARYPLTFDSAYVNLVLQKVHPSTHSHSQRQAAAMCNFAKNTRCGGVAGAFPPSSSALDSFPSYFAHALGGTMTKLFVGSLPFDVTEDQLHEMFKAHGTVASAVLISDRDTGRSRGFGFVEMPTEAEAQAAIQALNGTEVGGRRIAVSVARPMERRGPGGGESRGGHKGGGGGGKGGFKRW
jgi:hypothetical protein